MLTEAKKELGGHRGPKERDNRVVVIGPKEPIGDPKGTNGANRCLLKPHWPNTTNMMLIGDDKGLNISLSLKS